MVLLLLLYEDLGRNNHFLFTRNEITSTTIKNCFLSIKNSFFKRSVLITFVVQLTKKEHSIFNGASQTSKAYILQAYKEYVIKNLTSQGKELPTQPKELSLN